MPVQDSIGADPKDSTSMAMEHSATTDNNTVMNMEVKSFLSSSNTVEASGSAQSDFSTQPERYAAPQVPANLSNIHQKYHDSPNNAASPKMTSILPRINHNVQQPEAYDQAKDHVLKSIITSDQLPALPAPIRGGRGRGRPRKYPHSLNGTTTHAELDGSFTSPTSPLASTIESMNAIDVQVGKRGRGRPRGSTNRNITSPSSRGIGFRKGRKRKRFSDDEGSEFDDEFIVHDLPLKSTTTRNEKADFNGTGLSTHTPVQTKSGRQVHKPAPFVPISASPLSANGKKARRRTTFGSGGSLGRRNPESALCKVCDRGYSPLNNMVVFCDGCGDAYHQYCHHPAIDKEVVDVTDKEWFCKNCIKRREGGLELNGFVNGTQMSLVEKRSALESLSKEKLIEVLMAINVAHPHFAIFPSNDLQDSLTAENAPPEAHYDGYETDPPSHYPKPGHGLARTLPLEKDDMPGLLDDNGEVFNRITYSTHDMDVKMSNVAADGQSTTLLRNGIGHENSIVG